MEEESWRRNLGEGFMEEESGRRNHGVEESRRRNHGGAIWVGGIVGEESGRSNEVGGIREEYSWRSYLGGFWEASGEHLGGIWEASGGIWEASGRHLEQA